MQHTLSNTATGDPAGTFAYAAPEMLMGEKWDDKVGQLMLLLSSDPLPTVHLHASFCMLYIDARSCHDWHGQSD